MTRLVQSELWLENDVRAGRAGAVRIRTWLSVKGVDFYERINNFHCFLLSRSHNSTVIVGLYYLKNVVSRRIWESITEIQASFPWRAKR